MISRQATASGCGPVLVSAPEPERGRATASYAASAATGPAGLEAATIRTRLLATRFGRIAVHMAGDSGPVLLFWPAVFSDSSIYRAQVEALRGRHRLILIDGPGFGRSDAPTRPFTMEACSDAAAEVLRQLEVPHVVWAGTSWGGIVGVHFAIRHPQLVRGLALMNTPFGVPADGPRFSDRMVVWGARWIGNSTVYATGVARSFLPATWRNAHSEEFAAFVAALRSSDRAGMAVSARSVLLQRACVLPLLPRIDVPAVVVAGEDDQLYPAPTLKAAADRIPGARFVMLPSSGHISAMDQPEQVGAVLMELVEQVR